MIGFLPAEYIEILPHYNSGVSAESKALALIHAEFNQAISKTIFGQLLIPLLTDLEEVFLECLDEGWDGYNARPLSIASYTDALNFLRLIPTNIYAPDIVPEPSGGIGLEWISSDTGRFVLSFDGSGTYAYAGIFKSGARVRGIEPMSNSFPKELKDFITRLYRK